MPVQPQALPFDPASIPGLSAGLKARFLRGGMSDWQQAGRPMQAKS